MNHYDVILVGQGLAGSVLLRYLRQHGKRVFVFDQNKKQTSSKIAAGLVNPITGRRFVKSWKFDQFNQVSRKFYDDWDETLDEQLVYDIPLVRTVEDFRFQDDVEAKTVDEHYKDFISYHVPQNAGYLHLSDVSYRIKQAYRVDIKLLLNKTLLDLKENQEISFDSMEYKALDISDKLIIYKNISADHIIFCEGAAATKNPFFSHLPFKLTKGELLEIKVEQALDYAYKKGLIVLPIAADLLWCGALSYWEYTNAEPSDEGEMILIQKLKKVFAAPIQIENHLAAIRPTVRDRQPMIGQHSKFSRMYIFNGMGTKGTLLAPFFADQLINHIYHGESIMPEADIKRFIK